ncbi:hypothetical protein PF005_g24148 [Phytophthora fragariae]|uniref:Uncharacterized protein n=1 Tax=Phytophthora fragariae TaxID=53985 RepID=A0A6A3I979_9STRA|nr:hypothetical protein PF009_g25068 [Phytophthora fragariae]KAE8978397.1 hypothetical protein PF011_g23260 [Phytophthora fragariae]KAE9074998.1 hypothetical protein PF010_g24470 [Phytophthora fragariae]KAE9078724.1 hypothetical protein PF007_g23731 [Phytophthora fragariae]KAE9178273.1 hypothetical protein PF005_g24148 [Phytophthora fragariae]
MNRDSDSVTIPCNPVTYLYQLPRSDVNVPPAAHVRGSTQHHGRGATGFRTEKQRGVFRRCWCRCAVAHHLSARFEEDDAAVAGPLLLDTRPLEFAVDENRMLLGDGK